MATTPVYGWPYQVLTDAPNGPTLGQNLALGIETTVAAIDSRAPVIKRGSASVSFSAVALMNVTVNFPTAFAATPIIPAPQVISSAGAAVGWKILITAKSASAFTMRVDLVGAATLTLSVDWIAVAP